MFSHFFKILTYILELHPPESWPGFGIDKIVFFLIILILCIMVLTRIRKETYINFFVIILYSKWQYAYDCVGYDVISVYEHMLEICLHEYTVITQIIYIYCIQYCTLYSVHNMVIYVHTILQQGGGYNFKVTFNYLTI